MLSEQDRLRSRDAAAELEVVAAGPQPRLDRADRREQVAGARRPHVADAEGLRSDLRMEAAGEPASRILGRRSVPWTPFGYRGAESVFAACSSDVGI